MEKNYSGLILVALGILIIFWGISGGAIASGLLPIVGAFMILIGISLFVKMKKWYWVVIALIIIFLVWITLALLIPFKQI